LTPISPTLGGASQTVLTGMATTFEKIAAVVAQDELTRIR
jgi:hypothetical protein